MPGKEQTPQQGPKSERVMSSESSAITPSGLLALALPLLGAYVEAEARSMSTRIDAISANMGLTDIEKENRASLEVGVTALRLEGIYRAFNIINAVMTGSSHDNDGRVISPEERTHLSGRTEVIPSLGISVGKLLKIFREEASMSQVQLAQNSGLDIATINRLERGKGRPPRLSTLNKIISGFGWEDDDFHAEILLSSAQLKKRAISIDKPESFPGSQIPEEVIDEWKKFIWGKPPVEGSPEDKVLKLIRQQYKIHPWIEPVNEGWRQIPHEYSSGIAYHPKSSEVRSHPVLYQLFARYHPTPTTRLWCRRLADKFMRGEIVTDQELQHLPNPPRWTRLITKKWPELTTPHHT